MKKRKKHYILGYDYVELTTYGKYDEKTDNQEQLFFCVPKKWAEDWLSAYDGRKLIQFLDEYTWDDTEQMYADAKRNGQLLPNDSENKIHYWLFGSNKKLIDEINGLTDASFYDVLMGVAQSVGVSYIDVNGFCDKLRSILSEIQNNLIEGYGSVHEFIEAADNNL